MTTTVILSLGITLVFVFLLLSIMVTAINDLVFTIWRARAKQLEDFLANLFFNDTLWTELFTRIKDSPFINVLKKDQKSFPGAIPAETFTTALLADITNNTLTIQAVKDAVTANHGTKSDFYMMLATLLSKEPTFDQLRNDLEKMFDNSMERLTGWYKRKAKILSFVVGLIICVTLNVDTITITRNLWHNKDKAEQIATFAAAASKSFQINDSSEVELKSDKEVIASIKFENKALTKSNLGEAISKIDTSGGNKKERQLVGSYNILANLDIPIGWSKENIPVKSEDCWLNFWMWFLKILGMLLTTAAVSLGAPYWFDILNKISPLKK